MLNLWEGCGAARTGNISLERLKPHMTADALARTYARCPGAKSVLCAAFPYRADEHEGNLSRYARGADYHVAVRRRLSIAAQRLRAAHPEAGCAILVDDSPLPEVLACALAGVGLVGTNGLLIVPPYGSYVFLGTLLTDLTLPETGPAVLTRCADCGACVRACPAGAVSSGGVPGVDGTRCLSALTQKSGPLSPEEEELIRRHPFIWGCDICQEVCPYNAGAALTPLAEFREERIFRLEEETLKGLSRRAFMKKYPDRAFTWRGPAPLLRNLRIKHE